MAEFGFSAKVGADVSGFQKGMQKAEKALKKFSDGITNIGKKGIVGSLANVSLAMGGVVTAFKTATKVVKDVAKAVGECTDAYKTQAIAERTLQTAIENNPYISGTSLSALKKFASEMQAVSNYGDEQILQLETQLVSLGRTEEETMKIIKVATDMASSGTMSLDTAITQLNATLNGNVGRLGQQNAELKSLTEEELKSGKAIDILGEKFKGLASATVDTSKQLQNIKGDFKEAIGQFTLPSSDVWNKFWMGFYQKGIDIVHALQESLDSSRGEGIYEKLAGSVKKIKDEEQKRWLIEEALTNSNTIELNQLQTYLEGIKKRNKQEEQTLELVKQTLQYRKDAEEAVERGKMLEERDEAERQKALDAQAEQEEKIVKLKEEYLAKIAEQEAKWENIKTVTGQAVDDEEKLTFYQDALVDLMTKAEGQITTNNQLYKDQMKIISSLVKTTKGTIDSGYSTRLLQQAIELAQRERDEKLKNEQLTESQKYEISVEYSQKIIELRRQQIEQEKQLALEKVAGYENAEEEIAKIQEYYLNQTKMMIEDEQVEPLQEANAELVASTRTTWQKITDTIRNALNIMKPILKEFANKMAQDFLESFKNIPKNLKNIFSSVKGILNKAFNFKIDDALDNLLVFEDKILTFFVETLPHLPQFLASAMQSVMVLLQSILQSGGFLNLADTLTSMIESAMSEIPKIVSVLIPIVEKVIQTLFKALTSSVPKVIKGIVDFVGKLAKKIPQVVKVLLPAVVQIINDIIKALPSLLNEVLPSLLQAVIELVKALLQNMPTIIQTVVEVLPQLIFGVVQAIADMIANLNADDFVAIVGGVIKAVATLGVSLVKAIPEILKGLWELAKGLVKGMWNLIVEALKATWKGLKWVLNLVVDWFKDTFGAYATGTNNAQKGYALVGEQGPEIVKFNGGEKVYNATDTQRMLKGSAGAGGGGNSFNITFNNTQDTTAYAMMQQLRAYNRQMAINGVI